MRSGRGSQLCRSQNVPYQTVIETPLFLPIEVGGRGQTHCVSHQFKPPDHLLFQNRIVLQRQRPGSCIAAQRQLQRTTTRHRASGGGAATTSSNTAGSFQQRRLSRLQFYRLRCRVRSPRPGPRNIRSLSCASTMGGWLFLERMSSRLQGQAADTGQGGQAGVP